MSTCHRRLAVALVVVGSLLLPHASIAQVLDGIARDYQAYSTVWLQRLAPLARTTFALLALLQVATVAMWALLRGDALDALLARFIRQFITIGFFFSLVLFYPSFIPAVTKSFEMAGQAASGATSIDPSAVFDLGVQIATNMALSFGVIGTIAIPGANIIVLVVLLCFVVVACQITLTLVETAIVLPAGIFFLGFAPFKPTAGLAEAYLTKLVELGCRIFVLYLLVGVGVDLAQSWASVDFFSAQLILEAGLRPHLQVLGGSLVFAIMVWRIPNDFAIAISRGARFGLADALSS